MKLLLAASLVFTASAMPFGVAAQPPAPPPAAQAPSQTAPQTPSQTAPQTPALPPDTANPASQVGPTYVIGPKDGIQVTVWKDASLSGSLMVRTDGMITMPLLGDIPAAGFTPMSLAADLTSRLKKYMNDPLVSVTVLAVNSKLVYLLGEVGHIGPIPYSPGMSPLQVIATAGGLSAYANARHIYILRIENGKQKKIFYDYKKAMKTGNEQGVTLMPGDTVVVP